MNSDSDVGDDDVAICAKQAAPIIGCSTWYVYELCKTGQLPHYRVGRLGRVNTNH